MVKIMEQSTNTNSNNNSNLNNKKWLNKAEIASVILAIGGSVASVVLQNVAFASIPLSASVGLNLLNRKRLIELGDNNNHHKLVQLAQYSKTNIEAIQEKIEEIKTQIIAELTHKQEESQTYIEALSQKLQELQDLTIAELTTKSQANSEKIQEIEQLTIGELVERSKLINTSNENAAHINELSTQLQEIQEFSIAELIEQSKIYEHNLDDLSQKLKKVQQTALTQLSNQGQIHQKNLEKLSGQVMKVHKLTSSLKDDTQGLKKYAQTIETKQEEIAEVVQCLKEIDSKTHALETAKTPDEANFDLGLNHERLGDNQTAIADYTNVLEINPTHAKAYYHRGVLLYKAGDKQGAIDDLRNAAKYSFEEGDIARYQKSKELTKEIHHIIHQDQQENPKIIVQGLFE